MRTLCIVGAGLVLSGCTAVNQRFDDTGPDYVESSSSGTSGGEETGVGSTGVGSTQGDSAEESSTGLDVEVVCTPELTDELAACLVELEWATQLDDLDTEALGRAPFRRDLIPECVDAGPTEEYFASVCPGDGPWCRDLESFDLAMAECRREFSNGVEFEKNSALLDQALESFAAAPPDCPTQCSVEALVRRFEPTSAPTLAGDAMSDVLAGASLDFRMPLIERYRGLGPAIFPYADGMENLIEFFPSEPGEWEFAIAGEGLPDGPGCFDDGTVFIAIHRGYRILASQEFEPC